VDVEPLWCGGPRLTELLATRGLDGDRGKGRDVWLGLGRALEEEFVVVHDADTKTYSPAFVTRLLFPLARHDFSKGYYARVEDGSLYGRLFRLFFRPLVRALADATERREPGILEYLDAFRYALAGEFAATTDLVSRLRIQRGWGAGGRDARRGVRARRLRGERAGRSGAVRARPPLRRRADRARRHEGGRRAATLRAVEGAGVVEIEYDTLADRYREAADGLIRGYETDAAFNGLDYDRGPNASRWRRTPTPSASQSRTPACRRGETRPSRPPKSATRASRPRGGAG